MGAAGREHVRRNFLVTRHLSDYLACSPISPGDGKRSSSPTRSGPPSRGSAPPTSWWAWPPPDRAPPSRRWRGGARGPRRALRRPGRGGRARGPGPVRGGAGGAGLRVGPGARGPGGRGRTRRRRRARLGPAVRTMLTVGRRLEARALVMLNADLGSTTGGVAPGPATPVLKDDVGLVLPIYHRYRYDGTLTRPSSCRSCAASSAGSSCIRSPRSSPARGRPPMPSGPAGLGDGLAAGSSSGCPGPRSSGASRWARRWLGPRTVAATQPPARSSRTGGPGGRCLLPWRAVGELLARRPGIGAGADLPACARAPAGRPAVDASACRSASSRACAISCRLGAHPGSLRSGRGPRAQ